MATELATQIEKLKEIQQQLSNPANATPANLISYTRTLVLCIVEILGDLTKTATTQDQKIRSLEDRIAAMERNRPSVDDA